MCRTLETLVQRRQVRGHLLASFAADQEQDEDRTDATAFEVDRDGEARRGVAEGSTVASTMARMGPSIPAHPRVLGASMHTIPEVPGRAAKPMLLAVTHRTPRPGTPPLPYAPHPHPLPSRQPHRTPPV